MNGETLEDMRRSTSEDPLGCLKRAIATYDNELARNSAKRVVEEKIDPMKALDVHCLPPKDLKYMI